MAAVRCVRPLLRRGTHGQFLKRSPGLFPGERSLEKSEKSSQESGQCLEEGKRIPFRLLGRSIRESVGDLLNEILWNSLVLHVHDFNPEPSGFSYASQEVRDGMKERFATYFPEPTEGTKPVSRPRLFHLGGDSMLQTVSWPLAV